MTASVVLQNVLYTLGALVAIIILSLAVTLRHRKPKSVEANMASFNRGLRALAPDSEPVRRRRPPPPPISPPLPASIRPRTVQAVRPGDPAGTAASAGPHDMEA